MSFPLGLFVTELLSIYRKTMNHSTRKQTIARPWNISDATALNKYLTHPKWKDIQCAAHFCVAPQASLPQLWRRANCITSHVLSHLFI